MVATFDYSNYPIVKVDLSGSINSNDDFKSLTVPWLELYDLKEYFELEFNTKNINYVNPMYCIYTCL